MPKVSIILPVYNAQKYIVKAVESILMQTFQDFELILINDGSTDSSFKILKDFSKKDPRIRLISRNNKGLVATLNEGIDLAKAPLIARMDADDIALPNRIEIQKKYMDENPDVVCIGTGARVIDSKGRFLINMRTVIGQQEVLDAALCGRTPVCHPTAMYRTNIVKAAGGYLQEDYPAEDLALWLRLTHFGGVDNLVDPLIEYRIHSDSISTQQHDSQIKKIQEICKRESLLRDRAFKCDAVVGRASNTRSSRFEMTLKYGWWAFNSKEWKTAGIYGFDAIKIKPFDQNGWRLLFCSIFKR